MRMRFKTKTVQAAAPRPRKIVIVEPLETIEQQMFIHQVTLHLGKYPELSLLFAIPNGARVSPTQANKLKKEGMKAGVPDLMLPIARGGYFGWWGEMKRLRSGEVSHEQQYFIEALREKGHWAAWHRGADEMWHDLLWYLSLPPTYLHAVTAAIPDRKQRPLPVRKLEIIKGGVK